MFSMEKATKVLLRVSCYVADPSSGAFFTPGSGVPLRFVQIPDPTHITNILPLITKIQVQKGTASRIRRFDPLHICDCDKFRYAYWKASTLSRYIFINLNTFTLDVHNSKTYIGWIFCTRSCYTREYVLLFAGCNPLLDVGPAHRVRRGGQGHVRVSPRWPHAHRCISPGRLLLHMQTVRIGRWRKLMVRSSSLKRVWHAIFDLRLFHESISSTGAISNFYENSWRYSKIKANDTGDKCFLKN